MPWRANLNVVMLREVAEYPNSFVALAPGQERIETSRFTLCLERSMWAATVQRQDFAVEEIDAVLAEVRGLLRERGRSRTQWEIGSAARAVQEQAFGAPPERIEENRRTAAAEFAATAGVPIMHAVWDDVTGRIVGAGAAGLTPHALALFGGAVLPEARGRGAYRALIAERWAEAQRRGLPALVTQAGAMSRPILERLGFTDVGRVDMLVDKAF